MNKQKLQTDLDFGFRSETTATKYLEEFFECILYNTRIDDGDQYNKFDYRGDIGKVEIKTRRCKFGDYPDLQFELGKIEDGLTFLEENPDKKCYFVWRCINNGWGKEGFYYWELKPQSREWFKGEGGRFDRGKDEWKILAKIKNEHIMKMF